VRFFIEADRISPTDDYAIVFERDTFGRLIPGRPRFADAASDDGHTRIGSPRRQDESKRAVAATHDLCVAGQQAARGVAQEGKAGARIAAEGKTIPGEDHLPAGPIAVEDGHPGVLQQQVRQPDRPADREPNRDEPGRAAGDLELQGWIAGARCLGHQRLDRIEEDAPDQAADKARRSGHCASGSVIA
jgi:hypothetical protein